jgi:hypothetical protein
MRKPTQLQISDKSHCLNLPLFTLCLSFLAGFVFCYVFCQRALPEEGRESHDGCEKQIVQFNVCIDEVVSASRAAGEMRVDAARCQELYGGSLQLCIRAWEVTAVRWNPGSQSRITDTRYGPVLFNVNDLYVGRSLKMYGEWSGLETSEVYVNEIKHGNVVLDVGANIGSMAMVFSHLVGPTGLGRVVMLLL